MTIFDRIPYAVDIFANGVIGTFKRIVDWPTQCLQTFIPESEGAKRFSYPKECALLDDKEINEECKENPQLQSIMRRTQQVVDDLRKKMGILQEVAIYINPTPGNDGSCLGSRSFSNKIVIILNGFALWLNKEELDFLIAHELSHAANNDSFKMWAYSSAVLTAEIAALFFLTPYSIPLIEMALSPLNWFIARSAEKNADLCAIKTLRSSKGALAYFKKGQKANLERKNIGDRYSPEGDDRHDLIHPRISERIRYCEEFASSNNL